MSFLGRKRGAVPDAVDVVSPRERPISEDINDLLDERTAAGLRVDWTNDSGTSAEAQDPMVSAPTPAGEGLAAAPPTDDQDDQGGVSGALSWIRPAESTETGNEPASDRNAQTESVLEARPQESGTDTSEEPGTAIVEDVGADASEKAGPKTVEEVGPDTSEKAKRRPADWYPHEDGRWVVGVAGSLPMVEQRPTRRQAGAPPDTCLDYANVGALVYRAASIRGYGHQETGKPRQDAAGVRVTKSEDWLVAVVADGVSNSHRSEEGAAIAVDTIARAMIGVLEDEPVPQDRTQWETLVHRLPWQSAQQETNAALQAKAREMLETVYRGLKDSEALESLADELPASQVKSLLATTAVAMIAAARPDASGRFPFVVCVLAGDSAAFVLRRSGWHKLISVKDASGEIASNSVRPLPSDDPPIVSAGYLEAGDVLAIFSDGISDPLGSGQGVVGRFFGEMWQSPPDIIDFLRQVAFYRKGFFDDRSAVAVWTVGQQ